MSVQVYCRNERTKDRRYTAKPTAPSRATALRTKAPTSPSQTYCRSSHKAYPKKNSTAAEIKILWAVVTDTTHLQTPEYPSSAGLCATYSFPLEQQTMQFSISSLLSSAYSKR